MEDKKKYRLSYAIGETLMSSMDDRTIPDILKLHYEDRPEKEAIVFAHTNGTREPITYKDIYKYSSNVAKSYLSLGVKPSEIIAITMRPCPQWLYAAFGAMIAGAWPIGLSFTYKDGSDVIAAMKKLRTCSAIILDPGVDDENWNVFLKLVNSYDGKGNVQSDQMPYLRYLIYHDRSERQTPNVLTMEQIMKSNKSDITLPCLKPDDIAIMFQTSGSTGVPKAVVHTHRSIINAVSSPADNLKRVYSPSGPLFNDRPFTWLGGFPLTVISGTTRVTRCGYCCPPEDHIGFLIKVIQREKCTCLLALPGMLNMFLERQVSDFVQSRKCINGIEAMCTGFVYCSIHENVTTETICTDFGLCSNHENVENAKETLQALLKQYCLTLKAQITIAADDKLGDIFSNFQKNKDSLGGDWPVQTVVTGGQPMSKHFASGIGKLFKQILPIYGSGELLLCIHKCFSHQDDFEDFCCGTVSPGIEVKIVDENEETVPINTHGELYVKSVFAFKEYYNEPEKTMGSFTSDGWFKTDDIGFMDEDGIIFCIGRKSQTIISGGMNVAPSILEATLERYSGVAQAICVPVPHDILYQVVCACILLEEGSDVTEDQLRMYCEDTHNDRSRMFTVLPTYYLFMPEFPETLTGKTARAILTTQATKLFKGK